MIFPPGVRCATSPISATLGDLPAAEQALGARAVDKRQRELATGRVLARRLLAELGVHDWALLADADRAPLWPDGVIGSISHTRDLCVVAVARRGAELGLGVDVERADAVGRDLWRRILREEESDWLAKQPCAEQPALAAAFFSAKEAVYKAQFPLTRARLGFHDVSLELTPEALEFRAHVPDFARTLLGRIERREHWVLSGVVITSAEIRA